MQELTADGQRRIEELALRYGTGTEAAMTLLRALVAGGGTMAQFSHPDLGGMGQWSQGGMIMVGDMFNNALKAKVDGLCVALAGLLADRSNWREPAADPGWSGGIGQASLFIPANGGHFANWWGADLGHASSTGAQNATRYAYFPGTRRLAIEVGGVVTLYDTGDHQIGGVSQQQSGDASLTFTSQYGLVRVGDLPVVSHETAGWAPQPAAQTLYSPPSQAEAAPLDAEPAVPPSMAAPAQDEGRSAPFLQTPPLTAGPDRSQDILTLIERLAALRDKNILSEEEFSAKKTELLARL